MSSRLEFHEDLVSLLGSNHVYYQPPESVKMVYPCFVYELNSIDQRDADDFNYGRIRGYSVTYISKDPDNDVIDSVLDTFRYCRYDRRYVADNLYHDSFIIYY